MKRLLLAATLLLTFVQATQAQAPYWNWGRRTGGGAYDRATAITRTADGNLLTTGTFQGVSYFGSTQLTAGIATGIFLCKYDTTGNIVWVKKAGECTGDIKPFNVFEDDNNNIIVVGYCGLYNSGVNTASFPGASSFTTYNGKDIFIAKYNSGGDLTWVRHLGCSEEDFAVAAMDGNNIILQGRMYSNFYAQTSSGNDSLTTDNKYHLWFARYNTSGDVTHLDKVASSLSGIDPAGIAVDARGDFYLAGTYYSPFTVGVVPDTASLENASIYHDIYLFKLRHNGLTLAWQQNIHGPNDDVIQTLHFNSANSLVMTGSNPIAGRFGIIPDTIYIPKSLTGRNNFICSYDTLGTVQWAKVAANTPGGFVYYNAVTKDAAGNMYFAGSCSGVPVMGTGGNTKTLDRGNSLYVAKYNSNGDFEWVREGDAIVTDADLNGIALDAHNNAYVAGYFTTLCVLDENASDTISLTGFGFTDALVARAGSSFPTAIASVREANSLVLYPNPCTGKILVSGSEWNNSEIRICNLLGSVMLSYKINSNAGYLSVDVTTLAKGVYLLSIENRNGRTIRKFVKE